MQQTAIEKMLCSATTDEALANTAAYLSQQLKRIVNPREAVLICFPREGKTSIGRLIGEAATSCGGKPIFWENDFRWKTLLMLAFRSKAKVIVAPPMIVLGLSKISRQKGIPLAIRKTILAGYTSQSWMIEGIVQGLDCTIDGCFDPIGNGVVAGFSCQYGRGVHIRDDIYDVEIVDQQGTPVPEGKQGEIILSLKEDPDSRVRINSVASLQKSGCRCGSCSPKLIGFDFSEDFFFVNDRIGESLLYWNSILDCRVEKTEFGLELEVVVFPGEQLPKLPSCARLIIRPWNPDKDIPISLSNSWYKPNFSE